MSTEPQRWSARNKYDLVIEIWESLDCDSVGGPELLAIQEEVCRQFGVGAVDSPALIARWLAEEGAILRHPEVLECDTRWREEKFTGPISEGPIGELGLKEAARWITKLDIWRKELDSAGEDESIWRNAALALKEHALMLDASVLSHEPQRITAREVTLWLGVWLRNPDLFADWITLRLRSPEFRAHFGDSADRLF